MWNSSNYVCFIIISLAFWIQELLRKLYCVYDELLQVRKQSRLSLSGQPVSLIHRVHIIQT